MILKEYELPVKHERPCVYFLIFENRIIYVGQSRNVARRCGEHAAWCEFDKVLFFECDEDHINELERRFIFELTPECNTEWCDRSSGWTYKPEDILDKEVVDRRIRQLRHEDNPNNHILDRPITVLNFSDRTLNRLVFKNVKYIGDIQELGANGILGFTGIGVKALNEIRAVMKSVGVEFK